MFLLTRVGEQLLSLLRHSFTFQIKASFGINHFQVKYFDEDNEEASAHYCRFAVLVLWLAIR